MSVGERVEIRPRAPYCLTEMEVDALGFEQIWGSPYEYFVDFGRSSRIVYDSLHVEYSIESFRNSFWEPADGVSPFIPESYADIEAMIRMFG